MRNRRRPMRPNSGRMKSLLSIVILTMWTGGCATAVSSRYECPPLKKYSKEFQLKVADEPKGVATKQLVSDYGQLRDACRALEATK